MSLFNYKLNITQNTTLRNCQCSVEVSFVPSAWNFQVKVDILLVEM
jgi:hypothetical protein